MQFFVLTDEPRRAVAVSFIRSLNLGTAWSIEVKKYKKHRSKAQNRLMWSWLNIMAEFTGDKPDDLHELLKMKFLGVEEKTVMGEKITCVKSTTDLNADEFGQYLVKVGALASSLGIVLPMPDDRNFALYGG